MLAAPQHHALPAKRAAAARRTAARIALQHAAFVLRSLPAHQDAYRCFA